MGNLQQQKKKKKILLLLRKRTSVQDLREIARKSLQFMYEKIHEEKNKKNFHFSFLHLPHLYH